MNPHQTIELVKAAYGRLAQEAAAPDGVASQACCATVEETGQPVGDLGVSCGNPVAFDVIQPGDTVLDLGSGAGRDCFLAAEKAGLHGRVIGLDMTSAMLALAEANRQTLNLPQVTFVEGRIEALPLDDATVDVILSNCVINLSADKAAVFREAYRVLKPGGSLMVSDVVLATPLPEALKSRADLYCGCLSGALPKNDYLELIRVAGFRQVEILKEVPYRNEMLTDRTLGAPDIPVQTSLSLTYRAIKG